MPRAEASKPGRFARATAALDEGRYDKSVAIDEDSGWKNRIQFPPRARQKPAQEDGDDSEIYNAMNKDLRTRVENNVICITRAGLRRKKRGSIWERWPPRVCPTM